jgi:hypothetical protein
MDTVKIVWLWSFAYVLIMKPLKWTSMLALLLCGFSLTYLLLIYGSHQCR